MSHKSNSTGIISYSTYIPKYRIKVADIARVWGKDPKAILRSLGIREKSVASIDEDSVTMAVHAASNAINTIAKKTSNISTTTRPELDIIFVGSETHPYAVNPTSTIVGELLGIGNSYLAADLEFACKAATAGMQAGLGLIESGRYKNALIIGSDKAQSKPHDPLEYASASGSAAFILGSKNIIADIKYITSYSSDTPDFWRRDGVRYPSHGGRFTGKPAYFTHVLEAGKKLFLESGKKPEEFAYCIFHMPNGKFPLKAALQLGFNKEQIEPSLIVKDIGNPYTASSLIGLAAVLDAANPGDYIFMVSYGSGAGSDGFILEVTESIIEYRKRQNESVREQIENKEHVSYVDYLKMGGKI